MTEISFFDRDHGVRVDKEAVMDDKALLLVTLLLAFSYEKAAAQELKTEAYACKVEFTGGLAYDADSKSWRSTTFQPKGKFVFRLKSVKPESGPGRHRKLCNSAIRLQVQFEKQSLSSCLSCRIRERLERE
jgi:hypothetical protein